jgi:hypothetical protein
MVRRLVVVSLAAAVGASALVASADEGGVRATLQCEHAAAPGRVRCDAELRTTRGAVRWADVAVIETPDFVSPLKGRVGPRDATARETDLWRWGLGLVGRDRGEGDVVTRIRAVVCEGDRCHAEESTASAHVVIGP